MAPRPPPLELTPRMYSVDPLPTPGGDPIRLRALLKQEAEDTLRKIENLQNHLALVHRSLASVSQ